MSDKPFSGQSTALHGSIIELLDAYSTGELASDERLLVEKHLENCASCRQFLQDTQRLHALLSAQASERLYEVPSVVEAVMQQIQPGENATVPMHSFEKLPQLSQRRIALPRVLVSIAAILIAGILVGSFLLVMDIMPVSVSSHPAKSVLVTPLQPTPHATAVQTVGLTQKDILWSLRMFDQNTGWATNKSGILRTSDGGQSWHIVSPPGDYDFGLSTVDFFSSQVAWVVAVNNTTQGYSTFVTSDGGKSWLRGDDLAGQIRLGPSVGIDSLSVINAQECWIFATVASVKNGLESEVLHSTDSGKDWSVLPIPASTTLRSITGTFLNSTTGWFISRQPNATGDSLSVLFMTRDGGVSWQEQSLALPAGFSTGSLWLPTFLNSKEGLLPLVFTKTGAVVSSVLIYTTHDGGASWNASSVLPLSTTLESGTISLDFWSDTPQVWGVTEIWRAATDGNGFQDHPIVHLTQDGGQSWSQIKSSDLLQIIGDSAFLSPVEGWALGVPGKAKADVPPLPQGTPGRTGGLLLKTSDGGRTWQAMPVVVN